MYGATQVLAESAEIHDTCIRLRVLCLWQHVQYGRTTCIQLSATAAAVQQPEGWRIVDPPPCLGGSTHRWVPVDTHSTPVPERDGCVAHVIRQHSSTVQKHPKHGSGALGSKSTGDESLFVL